MNRKERILTFQRGVAALEVASAANEPSSSEWPEDHDAVLFLRDLVGLSVRLQLVIGIQEDNSDLGDMAVSLYALETEDEVLERCERMLLERGPYRESPECGGAEHVEAIRSLRALLSRYGKGEFMPADFPGTDHPSDG